MSVLKKASEYIDSPKKLVFRYRPIKKPLLQRIKKWFSDRIEW